MDRPRRASSGAAGANVRGGVGRCPRSRVGRIAAATFDARLVAPMRLYPLTDAANFLYLEPTLPQLTTLGCALLWLRVSEATPPSKAVRVFY